MACRHGAAVVLQRWLEARDATSATATQRQSVAIEALGLIEVCDARHLLSTERKRVRDSVNSLRSRRKLGLAPMKEQVRRRRKAEMIAFINGRPIPKKLTAYDPKHDTKWQLGLCSGAVRVCEFIARTEGHLALGCGTRYFARTCEAS